MNKKILAYVIGAALGDGNLSNPNGRAVRLRITCDTKYPLLIKSICKSVKIVMPDNKVSVVKKGANCVDISCYSNKWEELLGWKAKLGSKEKQEVSVPAWIKNSKSYIRYCLKGLFETDGSVYLDRGYKMANFTSTIPTLAKDVMEMVSSLGFRPNIQFLKNKNGKMKHTIRISRDVEKFIKKINIDKS